MFGFSRKESRSDSETIRVLTVADLHQRRSLYEQLETAVALHQPNILALVGDFLNVWQHGGNFLSVEECARRLNSLAAPEIVCVRGNHEDANWLDFYPQRIISLNGNAVASGPLVIVGFPCLLGDESWFLEGSAGVSANASDWFPKVARSYGSAARTLWLMHEPPSGTRLSVTTGPLAGNDEWRDAIAKYAPLLVICGHDHQTPFRGGSWRERVGQSWCLNAGQTRDTLHYFVIDIIFKGRNPSLASEMTAVYYPSGERLRVS